MSDPGAGFRGVLNYNLAARKRPELIGGNMAGETPRQLAHEFGLGRALNRAVEKPVFHASLTAAPGDNLSEDDWRRFGTAYLDRLGYGECQQVLIRHHNTEREHLHLVANRIDRHGRRVEDFQERRRGEAIVRDLEREFGITQVAPSRQARRAAPGRAELGRFARTGEVAVKTRLQEHVDMAARGGPSLPELAERLLAQGVGMRAHVAATGRLAGLSFELDGVCCKGSALGRGYSWLGLAGRAGVTYEPARDLARLRELGAVAVRAPAGGPEAKGTAAAAHEGPVVADQAPEGAGIEASGDAGGRPRSAGIARAAVAVTIGGGDHGAGAATATASAAGLRPEVAVTGQRPMQGPPAVPMTPATAAAPTTPATLPVAAMRAPTAGARDAVAVSQATAVVLTDAVPASQAPAVEGAARELLHARLRAAVEATARGGPTVTELADRLRAAGIEVRANLAATGRLAGLSFEIEGVRVKGSELGRQYAWRALASRHGIGFDLERDGPRLRERATEGDRQGLSRRTRSDGRGDGALDGADHGVTGGQAPGHGAANGQVASLVICDQATGRGATGGQVGIRAAARGQVAGLGMTDGQFAGHGAASGLVNGKVAGWAGSASGLLPAEARQVPVYRAAAVLRSRAEVLGRVEALSGAIKEQATIAHQGEELAAARAGDERARSAAARQALGREVLTAYSRPDAASSRLEELIAHQGAAGAAVLVRRSPESLGALRGVSVGGLQSAARRAALAARGRLAAELQAMADRQQKAAAEEPAGAAAAARTEAARAQLERLARALGRLPHRYQLEKEMVRAAEAVGARLTALLAPVRLAGMIAGRVARAAAALVRGRDDRSLGR